MTRTPRRTKRLRWDEPPRPASTHRYRDSAILYGILAVVFVAVIALTGGNIRAALVIAPTLFVIATAYSWWRLRQRERDEAREQ